MPAAAPVAQAPIPAPTPIEAQTFALDTGPLADTALAAVARAAIEMARDVKAAPAAAQLQDREPEIAAALGFEPIGIALKNDMAASRAQTKRAPKAFELLADDIGATEAAQPFPKARPVAPEAAQPEAALPASDFVSTPLADPAEFLLEPLTPTIQRTPPASPQAAVAILPGVAASPAQAPASSPLAVAPPAAAPRRDEALAPIIALSDEEKIALFS